MTDVDVVKLSGAAMACGEIIDRFPPKFRKALIRCIDSAYNEDGTNRIKAQIDAWLDDLREPGGTLSDTCKCKKPGKLREPGDGFCHGAFCDECWEVYQRCGCGKPGEHRVDNGLAAGFHCDDCWEKMVTDARSRSW